MGNFNFRLQPVLKLKQQLEKEQKVQFSRIVSRLNELLAYGEELDSSYRQWSRKYLGEASQGVSPNTAGLICQYLSGLREAIEQNETAIRAQEEEVEKQRAVLIEIMKERKLLETLRERQYSRFMEEEQRKQEKSLEEMIASRKKNDRNPEES